MQQTNLDQNKKLLKRYHQLWQYSGENAVTDSDNTLVKITTMTILWWKRSYQLWLYSGENAAWLWQYSGENAAINGDNILVKTLSVIVIIFCWKRCP